MMFHLNVQDDNDDI